MTQATLTNLDKAAILLWAMKPESKQDVLKRFAPAQATQLQSLMANIAKRSDLERVTQEVVREFQQLRRNGGSSAPIAPDAPRFDASHVARQYTESAETARLDDKLVSPETETGSVASRLTKIAAPVLARVLQTESPRVLVLILQSLPFEQAASVLKLLPPDRRGTAVSMMATGLSVPEPVSDCVLQTVLQQCSVIGSATETTVDEDAQVKRLVGILQIVDREERLRLMELLSEQNEAVAAKIDDCMYDYSDLLRIGDRSLQKILTQTDQKTLAMALKTASEDICEKVMKNMSERVRAALAEEMEFLSEVPSAKAEAARKDIAAIIRTQDKEGTLVWLES